MRLSSNVEGINLNSNKKINLAAGDSINMQAQTMFINAAGDLSLKADHPKIGGGAKVSISAAEVGIDDYVYMAQGASEAPDGAVTVAEAVNAAEPVGKSLSTSRNANYDGGAFGSSGYASQDEPEDYDADDLADDITDTSADAEISNRDSNIGEKSDIKDTERNSSSGSDVVEVLQNGKGFNVVRLADGSVVRRQGTRAWRNNNPGNIEYGNFAKSQGAIGTDGRFAIFPDYESGRGAKEKLLFGTNSYKNLTLSSAINRYAPSFENNTSAYITNVATSAGVSPGTKMSNIPISARTKILDAFERQEGFRSGKTTIVT